MNPINRAIETAKKNPNSEYATELRRRIESGMLDNELSVAGLSQAYNRPQVAQPTSFLDKTAVGQVLSKETAREIPRAAYDVLVGNALRFIKSGLEVPKDLVAQLQGQEIQSTDGTGFLGEPVQTFQKEFQDETIPQVIEGEKSPLGATAGVVGNVSIGALDVLGVAPAAKAVAGGVRAGARATQEGVESLSRNARKVAKAGKKTVAGIVDVVNPLVQDIKNIPSNIATNVSARKEIETTIRQLPVIAQKAARRGVDIEDISKTLEVNRAQKPALAKLWDKTKSFITNKTKNNPIESVGQPLVKKFKNVRGEITKLGGQLDEVAKGLKGKQVNGLDEVLVNVDNSLADIGVTFDEKGINFIGSNLEGLGSNEKIISNVYSRLINATDASDLHRLKKYIDNNVDFGKSSEGFTEQSKQLLKSWRSQIDTALDTSFPAYNTVNTELSIRINPINELKKLLKGATGFDEDLFELSAGQLMRRISSNVASNPSIRQTLRNIDSITVTKGETSNNIESLVDFYSTLEKYFPEIVGKNTFKGQIQGALNSSGGIMDTVRDTARRVGGQTEEVKRKAIIDFLDDFFTTKNLADLPKKSK